MARGKATGRYKPTRPRAQSGESSQRWLGTYGDAVTLLMAFFVMLYAMSQIDQHKFEAFLSGLEAPFGNPAVREGLLDASSGVVPEGAADDGPLNVAVTPELPVATDAPPPAAGPAAPPAVELDQLRRVRAAIDESLTASALRHHADFHMDERGLVISIAADDILFETGSTRISELGRRIIGAVAEPLARFGNDVLVEGHTDDAPLRRGDYTNWNLSTDRAVAVLSLLFTDFGVGQERLGAIGYGEFRPRVPNDSAVNRALNRRVDILVAAEGA
ncbi:MAG TPA: flagellar motor protein MotB [Egibacteraceae bacterium]|nr:flagellar motor protein MotB [Egibacteraceae bacterium]